MGRRMLLEELDQLWRGFLSKLQQKSCPVRVLHSGTNWSQWCLASLLFARGLSSLAFTPISPQNGSLKVQALARGTAWPWPPPWGLCTA